MIEKINDIGGVGGIGGVKSRRGVGYGAAEAGGVNDGLAVSDFAREMANISAELAKVPDVREDRVRDLKKQIDEGTYTIDADALARRLVWAGISKIED